MTNITEANYSDFNVVSVAFKQTVLSYFANTKSTSMKKKGPIHRVKALSLYPLTKMPPPPHPLTPLVHKQKTGRRGFFAGKR